MERLPLEFQNEMKALLGRQYPAFLACYEQKPYRAVRVNPLKITAEKLKSLRPFALAPAPFAEDSFYIGEEAEGLGRHPLHHAGAFYVQEPSAASAVTVLDPRPGDRVLDLCAAPGGKSTQIAGRLMGEGLLWSNEIVKGRANILLSNLERMGARNAVVSSAHPEALCGRLAGFFDKVLADAPCSGEGMFRREPEAAGEWSVEHVKACAQRQSAILNAASQAVKEGGFLVYSTCTFSIYENEGVTERFLKEHPDFAIVTCGVSFGRPALIERARRIFPMDGGEGHYVVKFKRNSPNFYCGGYKRPQKHEKTAEKEIKDLLDTLLQAPLPGELGVFGGRAVLMPEGLPELSGLGVLRAGIPVCEIRKGRAEPEHGLFMAAKPEELKQVLSLSLSSPKLSAYLHGEEISAEGFSGYTGVAVEGIVTGFGKCSGGRMKNRYPKGLRNL